MIIRVYSKGLKENQTVITDFGFSQTFDYVMESWIKDKVIRGTVFEAHGDDVWISKEVKAAIPWECAIYIKQLVNPSKVRWDLKEEL